MIENLKRVREPVTWTILLAIVASMALSVVSLVRQVSGPEAREAVFAAFASIASNAMNLTLVVSLVALVCLCLFIAPPTPHAVGLARAALIVVSLGTLLTIVATALGVAASAGVAGIIFELLGGLLDIALKSAAVAVLWVIHRAVSAGRLAAPPAIEQEEPLPTRAIIPDAPPVWRPTEATGSVWATAADAAAGTLPAPSVPPAARAVPAPSTPDGAAEALGWRRVSEATPAPSTKPDGESRDTP